jgi:hypothetical protein
MNPQSCIKLTSKTTTAGRRIYGVGSAVLKFLSLVSAASNQSLASNLPTHSASVASAQNIERDHFQHAGGKVVFCGGREAVSRFVWRRSLMTRDAHPGIQLYLVPDPPFWLWGDAICWVLLCLAVFL